MLYVVATPIGNLDDITIRALETLKKVDLIACEDTRHSGILLKQYEIKKPLLSFHSHSGEAKVEKILDYLKEGKSVALISDAGTPGISDPGYALIQAVIKAGFNVCPIPGPSAVITALCASGLPTDKFTYMGFLPVKKGRQTLFQQMATHPYTMVFYESPHRLEKTIKDLKVHLKKETKIVIGKELTKIHETYLRGTLEDIEKTLSSIKIKGEYVVMISNV
ncbi:16S rRNA (cytidine(1402)-2'-O)-methyltransferase [Candidatus Peregrinibacteria bacterium]|nr:MAG: 16S rRNA (cytidine(1402)-2'-O)-methyltransferase [Candidatus Peregrinibacteria bacterium]